MNVFFNVLPPAEARRLLLDQVVPQIRPEVVLTAEALSRVTATRLTAPHPLPTFRRSTMDGYAVRAADTYGASATLPAVLRVVSEVLMGQPASVVLSAGEAAIIHTGGQLPASAEAVVQVENTQPVSSTTRGQVAPGDDIEVTRAVAIGENVIQIGEDVLEGEEILPMGHWLRPQDLGALAAMGIVEVPVVRRPRVAIISTGDEVIPPHQPLGPGQVRDVNSYTAAAQTRQAGGEPLIYGIIPDNLEALRGAAERAMDEADLLVFSAGSSVSVRDATARVIEGLGKPGILFHGVAVRPGKPTIGAVVRGKPAFGLPGNPVSAMNLFDLLVAPTIHRLLGCLNPPQRSIVRARVARNVSGTPGREDRVATRLVEREGELWAEPIFGKSNLIFTLVRADGTFVVPLDAAGVTAGEWVEVQLF
jgi:molybdopterin molybdotransferase